MEASRCLRKVACRFGAVDVAGRLTDDLTVECFAPFHASGIVDVAVNGATGIHLRYNMTALDDAFRCGGRDGHRGDWRGAVWCQRRVSTLGSPRSVGDAQEEFLLPKFRDAMLENRAGRASLCRRH